MDNILKLMDEYIKHEKIEKLEKIKTQIDDIDEPDHDFEGFYYCFNEVMKILDKHIEKLKEE